MKVLIFLSLVMCASAQAGEAIRPVSYQTPPDTLCEPDYEEAYKSKNCCKAVTYDFEPASYVTRFCILPLDAMYLDALSDAIGKFKAQHCQKSERWRKKLIEIANKKNKQSPRARNLLWDLNTKEPQVCARSSGPQDQPIESNGIN